MARTYLSLVLLLSVEDEILSVLYETEFGWIGMLRVSDPAFTKTDVQTGIVMIFKGIAIANAAAIDSVDKKKISFFSRAIFFTGDREWSYRVRKCTTHADDTKTINTISLLLLEVPSQQDLMPSFLWSGIKMPEETSYQKTNDVYTIFIDEDSNNKKIVSRLKHYDFYQCESFYMNEGLDIESVWPIHYSCYTEMESSQKCLYKAGMASATNHSGNWILLGISTFGPGCALPSRFIDILPYVPWIKKTINYHSRRNTEDKQTNAHYYLDNFLMKNKPLEYPDFTTSDTTVSFPDIEASVQDNLRTPVTFNGHIGDGKTTSSDGTIHNYTYVKMPQEYYSNRDTVVMSYASDKDVTLYRVENEDNEIIYPYSGKGEDCPDTLVYREKGYYKSLRMSSTVFFSISLFDLRFNQIACIKTSVKCKGKSDTKVEFHKGTGQDDIPLFIGIAQPYAQQHEYIQYLKAHTWDTATKDNNDIILIWFKFNFFELAEIDVSFWATPKPTNTTSLYPTTASTKSVTKYTTTTAYRQRNFRTHWLRPNNRKGHGDPIGRKETSREKRERKEREDKTKKTTPEDKTNKTTPEDTTKKTTPPKPPRKRDIHDQTYPMENRASKTKNEELSLKYKQIKERQNTNVLYTSPTEKRYINIYQTHTKGRRIFKKYENSDKVTLNYKYIEKRRRSNHDARNLTLPIDNGAFKRYENSDKVTLNYKHIEKRRNPTVSFSIPNINVFTDVPPRYADKDVHEDLDSYEVTLNNKKRDIIERKRNPTVPFTSFEGKSYISNHQTSRKGRRAFKRHDNEEVTLNCKYVEKRQNPNISPAGKRDINNHQTSTIVLRAFKRYVDSEEVTTNNKYVVKIRNSTVPYMVPTESTRKDTHHYGRFGNKRSTIYVPTFRAQVRVANKQVKSPDAMQPTSPMPGIFRSTWSLLKGHIKFKENLLEHSNETVKLNYDQSMASSTGF